MRTFFLFIILVFFGLLSPFERIEAQTDNRARIAASLFSREDYNRALPLYEENQNDEQKEGSH
jgi:hypothetical protein